MGAQGTQWQQLASEDVELFTTRPDRDRALLPLATRLMHEAEESTGLVYSGAAKLKVYPTVAAFRDATGEPGWVAASTRGRTIRLQPTDVLRDAGTLESTLRHELLHMLVESHAKAGTPLWFREGLVLYLAQPNAEMRRECDVRQRGGAGEGVAGSSERAGIAAGVCGGAGAGGEVGARARERDADRLAAEWVAGAVSAVAQ